MCQQRPPYAQARHRTLNQGLLDLKRLYWNTPRFQKEPHRGQCPYQVLGLDLPSYDFWALLQAETAQTPGCNGAQPQATPAPC